MKPNTEIVDRAAFLRALAGKPASAPRARNQGKDTPAAKSTLSGAHSEPGVGDQQGALKRLSALRYFVRYRVGIGFDCWSPYSSLTTTPHATYAAAVQAAERELRGR